MTQSGRDLGSIQYPNYRQMTSIKIVFKYINEELHSKLCTEYVKPKLEYVSQVGTQHLQKQIW